MQVGGVHVSVSAVVCVCEEAGVKLVQTTFTRCLSHRAAVYPGHVDQLTRRITPTINTPGTTSRRATGAVNGRRRVMRRAQDAQWSA